MNFLEREEVIDLIQLNIEGVDENDNAITTLKDLLYQVENDLTVYEELE